MRFGIVSRGLVAAAMVMALVACGAQAPGTGSDEDRLNVVATTTQVGSIAREVGGDAIDLTVLLAPGVEAHDFELSPAQGAALERADLVLMSGAGLEEWLDDAIENAGAADRVRDMSEGVELRTPGDDEPTHTHGPDDDEHGPDDDEHGPDEDEHGHDEDEHGHDETDPHYWLTAENAIIMTENVRDALSEAAPEEADGFAERADAMIDRLEVADAEVRAIIDEIPPDQRKIVTDHDAMGYFVDAYGLEFVGSIFPSLDVSSEPSARDIEALVAEIEAHGVTAIFTETAVNPRLARAVAEETSARLVEEPLYTDSLGPEGSGADTMEGMLVHNARVIRDGLVGN
jgi:ABC-type Zn uptake system ZnuABC Zn-binding protein ZnuA